MDLGYRMFDADNHYYEKTDAFTRYLPKEFAKDFFWVHDQRGHQHIILNGRFWGDYIPNPTFDPISVAGALTDMFSGERPKDAVWADAWKLVEPLAQHPEYQDPTTRIARMDEQGIEACWIFPTLVSGIEQQIRRRVDLTYALLNSLNRWILDEWTFHYQDRIFATPVITLADVDEAIRQLEFALDNGARAVMMRPAPVPTAAGPRSPGDPMFDPFWARCVEAGIPVTCHAGETGYSAYAGDWTGKYELSPFTMTVFEQIATSGRAVSDFVTALLCHGAFTRNPGLKIVLIENGSAWVPHLVELLGKFYKRYHNEFPGHPLDEFAEGVHISPFWEDDIERLAQVVPVEHILAGSDWPHAEGMSEPADFAKGLQGFSAADQRKIMRDNGMALVGIRS